MKFFVVACRDNAVEEFMEPSTVRHTGAAIRAFADHCKDTKSNFYQHPQDFDLYCLGEFHSETGNMVAYEIPQRLARAIELVDKTAQPEPSLFDAVNKNGFAGFKPA